MPLGVMAAMAAASEEIFRLFEWNREVYKFDREQRLGREELRMEMQMERFKLFREDIRDLVELTVGRMDMYHLVGALFIEFCVVLFAEGRVHATAPPFLLSLYHFTLACSFVYLLLTVWLAMHSSIAAQSFGTRLLLRYVRLPVPTNAQIDALSANLAEYETQGVGNVLRVPFVQRPSWYNTEGTDANPHGPTGKGSSASTARAVASGLGLGLVSCVGKKYIADPAIDSPTSIIPGSSPKNGRRGDGLPDPDNRRIWLGKAEVPFSGEDDFLLSTAQLPGQHVELFRRLQAKWSCYDAYARVCVQFGVHHILMSLSYFAICVTMIENRSPTCGWAIVMALQACQMGITALDMSTFARHFLLALNSMSAAPLLAATMSITWAERHSNGAILEDNTYPAAFLAFAFQLAWLELLLYVASPDSDDGRVPRKSRTVFYMDVFGEAEETNERRDKDTEELDKPSDEMSPKTANAHRRLQQNVESVRSALSVTRASVLVWEDMPASALSEGQKRELERLSTQLELCHAVVRDQINWCVEKHLLPNYWSDELAQSDLRFVSALVGPFEQPSERGVEARFLDLESRNYLPSVPAGRQVITLAKIANMIQELKTRARCLRESAIECNGGQAGTGLARGIPRTPDEYRAILPWRVLCYVTRLVQFCLGWLCFVTVLRENNLWRLDYAEQPKGGGEEGEHVTHGAAPEEENEKGETSKKKKRRLGGSSGRLLFKRMEVLWPYGLFFRPEVLSCLPAAVLGGRQLLLGSPFAHYGVELPWEEGPFAVQQEVSAELDAATPLRLHELSADQHTPSAVALCSAPEAADRHAAPACLLAQVSSGGVEIWPFKESRTSESAVVLPVDGRPWRRLSGALLRCSSVDAVLLPQSPAPQLPGVQPEAEWCLLLAGWDGLRLPVALLPLPFGPSLPPAWGQRIRPGLDVPVLPAKRRTEQGRPATPDAGLVALHVEPRRATMWALLSGGELRAWDLLRPRSLGQWPPRWPAEARDFQGAALCEDEHQFLYVVGLSSASGPALLRADLLGEDTADQAAAVRLRGRPFRENEV